VRFVALPEARIVKLLTAKFAKNGREGRKERQEQSETDSFVLV
jgi:hypothetical protein